MKGPGLRIDLDVRRVWRCAKCERVVRTSGQVVAQRCGCSDAAPWMVLQLPPKREPFQPPVREHLPESWEEVPDPAMPPETESATRVVETALVESMLVESVSVEPVVVEPVVVEPLFEQPPSDEVAEAHVASTVPSEFPPLESPPAPSVHDDFGAGLADTAPELPS